LPIIETEIWKKNPDRPGTIIFDSQRVAQDIFSELTTHLAADGRMPDEYFLLSVDWRDGVLFPKDSEILCNVNYGGSEGIYIDIAVNYEKDVYEFNDATKTGCWMKRMVTEQFATGKTLGESISDLDKMNLVASSVMAAFYGKKSEVLERYAKVECGEPDRIYPLPHEMAVPIAEKHKQTLADKLQVAGDKAKAQDAHKNNKSHKREERYG